MLNGIGYGITNFTLFSGIAYGLGIGALFVYYKISRDNSNYNAQYISAIFYAIIFSVFKLSICLQSIGKFAEGTNCAWEVEKLWNRD